MLELNFDAKCDSEFLCVLNKAIYPHIYLIQFL